MSFRSEIAGPMMNRSMQDFVLGDNRISRSGPDDSVVRPTFVTMMHLSSKGGNVMALQLGDKVPNFTQDSTEGPIDMYEYAGNNWLVLFSHPKDFTPACTTELGAVAKLKPEFDKRGVKVLALSVDSVSSHKEWIKDIEDTQKTKVNYPIIADQDRKVANLYGMIHPNEDNVFTVRTVFVIDPDKKLR